MKPQSIIMFDRFYLGALAIDLIYALFNWGQALEEFNADPDLAGMGSAILILILAFSFGISLLLWYFVSKQASNVARWILMVFFILGLITFAVSFFGPEASDTVEKIVYAITTLMHGIALYMTFRPDAEAWFANKGGKSMDDLRKDFE